MIFTPDQIKLIHQGRKTMTRRPVLAHQRACPYKEGRVYGIKPGGRGPQAGKITVASIREERHGDISLKDARREGHRTTAEYIDMWIAEQGQFDPDRRMWVILFAKGEHSDQPRLLVARSGTAQGDYTTVSARAMSGEPEAVPRATQAAITADARLKPKMSERDQWLEQRERIVAAIRAIREIDLPRDVDSELRVLERRLISIDRKLYSHAA